MDNSYIFLKCGKTTFYIPEADEVVNPVSYAYYTYAVIFHKFQIGGRLQEECPRGLSLGNF
jgi:hypothetical protein